MRDAEAASRPLSDSDLEDLLAPFARAGLIALAVSGGADSLALMVAVARWSQRRQGRPHALVLTVDHRLRRGSGGEAADVVAAARAIGLNAGVLVREGPPPQADIEAAARRARYGLLIAAAKEAGASHLLTAHHRDDLAETFLLRIQRGAGVFGLAAMRPAIDVGGLVLARPLLDVPRARLAATTASAGLAPVIDPMNDDPRFARARMRKLLPLLAGEGLAPERLAATARRLAGVADAIDAAASDVIAAAITTDDCAVARLDTGRYLAAPSEVRMRVLVRLLIAVGGGDYPPRFDRLEALATAVATPDPARLKRTLAGCVIERREGAIVFHREIGRAPPEAVALKPGSPVVWDRRFRVAAGPAAGSGLTVAALGEAGRQAVAAGVKIAPVGALAALPAVWRRGRIVAVPSLGHFVRPAPAAELSVRPILGDRLAQPPLFPDFTEAG